MRVREIGSLMVLLACPGLRAQWSSSVVHVASGTDGQSDRFGFSVVSVGDVDGDRAPDFAAGARQLFFHPEAKGYVKLISGKTGEELRAWRGERQADRFGQAVAAMQSKGNTIKDLAIGNDGSEIAVYSLTLGNLVQRIDVSPRPEQSPATHRLKCVDLDGDGNDDLLVGQSGYSPGPPVGGTIAAGRVAAYSGQGTGLLWEKVGQEKFGELGHAIEPVGDVDGDERADVAVGEPRGNFPTDEHVPGIVYILSGTDGREIRQLGNDPRLSFFGISMANLGDLNGDDRPELAIGAPGFGEGRRKDLGWVGIYSTSDFTLLREFKGIDGHQGALFQGDRLGLAVGSAGDVDGDGAQDLLLGTGRISGALGRSAWGRIDLRSGRTGRLLAAYEGRQDNYEFLSVLATLGDIDGDGRSEFLIGSEEAPSGTSRGQVFVVRYLPELPTFLRGDANGDGKLDISDVVKLLEVFYFEAPPGPCLMALDVDGDRNLIEYEPIALLFYLFGGRFAPAPPFPECARHGGLEAPRISCDSSTCAPR